MKTHTTQRRHNILNDIRRSIRLHHARNSKQLQYVPHHIRDVKTMPHGIYIHLHPTQQRQGPHTTHACQCTYYNTPYLLVQVYVFGVNQVIFQDRIFDAIQGAASPVIVGQVINGGSPIVARPLLDDLRQGGLVSPLVPPKAPLFCWVRVSVRV